MAQFEDGTVIVNKFSVGDMDNNCYVVVCPRTKEAIIVDAAADAARILKEVEGLKVKSILTTHGHWDHIRAIQERGSTVFLTTHYLEEADALCDRLTIMDHGSIVAEGTPRELKREVVGDSVVLGLVDEGLVERASALLRTEPFIREIGVEAGGLRLYVADGSAALPELLRLFDREQIALKSISLSEPTLDDVFLRYTGRSLRDTGNSSEVAA